jgi:hypothetical protein
MKENTSQTAYLLRVGLFIIVATVESLSRKLAKAGLKLKNIFRLTHHDTSNEAGEFNHDSSHFKNSI